MGKDTKDLSPLAKAIRAEQDAAARRIAALKAEAAAEEQKINNKVIILLRCESEADYQSLADQARKVLQDEKSARSRNARAAAARRSSEQSYRAEQEPNDGSRYQQQ